MVVLWLPNDITWSAIVVHTHTEGCVDKHCIDPGEFNIPYILESNPYPFYSFRGLKNQMRIRIAVESWILEKL